MKAILFDLDDTLIDFKSMKKAAITEASKAMAKAGLGMKASEAYETLNSVYWEVGIESNSAIEEFLGRLGRLDDRILAAGINGYLRGKLSHTKPVEGAIGAIKKLKRRYKVAVVTDAPRLKAWQRLNLMGMDSLFDAVITFDDTGKKKPDEAPFKAALKKLGVKPEEAVMVGDWYERDVEGAKKVGMKAVLVGKPRCNEDYCVSKFKGILEINFEDGKKGSPS
jgi:HAD superfamily hydrolase (TIGR02253 family)